MTYLWTGIVLVAGSHLFSTLLPGLRDGLKQRLGEGPFKGLYSLVNVVGLVLMIVGFRWASPDSPQLYQPVAGAKHITMLLVLAAFILIGASHGKGYIKSKLHHPMSLGIASWSIGHLLANGRQVDVLLFGTLLVVAIADIVFSELRGKRPTHVPNARSDIIAILVGMVLYVVFLFGFHPYVLGISVAG